MKFISCRGIIVLTLLCTLLAAGQAMAFRCGTKLVSAGDTRNEVLEKCGEPESVETWTEERPRWYPRRHYYLPYWSDQLHRRDYKQPYIPTEIIRVEEWVYNLGANRFIRYLRFENGRLEEIETGDYGY